MRVQPITFTYIQNQKVQNKNINYGASVSSRIFALNSTDKITFGKKKDKLEAQAAYRELVADASCDISYEKPRIGANDIKFLLDLNNEDFEQIITKPVEYKDDNGHTNLSTVFFYTDVLATEKLLNKLNDRKAAYRILSVQKGWSGTTALHTAAYSNDPMKAQSICMAVNKNDLNKLLKLEEIDDTPIDIAIVKSEDVYNTLKQFEK